MNQPNTEAPESSEVTTEAPEATVATTEAPEVEETKETAQQKFLNFIKIWQTSESTAEVAERLGDKATVASCQARASKYRAIEYFEKKKLDKDKNQVFKCDIEGQPFTIDAKEAVLYGGEGPKAGKPVPAMVRIKDKEGKDKVKRQAVPLKHMPKGGGRQLDVNAALALMSELANES